MKNFSQIFRKLFGKKLQQNPEINNKLAQNINNKIENNELSTHFRSRLKQK